VLILSVVANGLCVFAVNVTYQRGGTSNIYKILLH
jgi:hypothetical protein